MITALSFLGAGFVYASGILPRQGTDSPCSTAVPACVSWEIAFTSCQDLACECSAAVSLGTQCGDACYITANPSAYSFLSTLASACIASHTSGAPASITPITTDLGTLSGANDCNTGNAACTAFSSSVANCAITDESCQCPIILQYGPACSSCYASYEPEIASAYAGIISACGGNAGGSVATATTGHATTTGGNTQQATAAAGGTNAKSTGTGSPSTTKSASGASRYDGFFGLSAVTGISVVVFMGSAVTLFFG